MKIGFLIVSLALLGLTSCNQTRKENSQNSEDTTKAKQGKAETNAVGEKHPGVYFVNLKDGDEFDSKTFQKVRHDGIRPQSEHLQLKTLCVSL